MKFVRFLGHGRWAVVWLFVVLLSGCSVSSQLLGDEEAAPSGRLLLWHTWTGPEGVVLQDLLGGYRELYPDVAVISVAVEAASIVERVTERSKSGLGPDLILADAAEIYELAQAGLLHDLAPLQIDLSQTPSEALRMVEDGEHLFALPFAAHTEILYYNKARVQKPSETLAELVEQVAAGEVFAQNYEFVESYWGVGAHDGGIVDGSGRLLLGLGGFTNWLDFLSTARSSPGFMLKNDPDLLEAAFLNGEAGYYVADSARYPDLAAAMGAGTLGISLLPTGPNGGIPSPFLRLDSFAFNQDSTETEFELARHLAHYLTDVPAQLFLASSELGRVPVHSEVRLSANLPANTLVVARQTRSAEPIAFANRELWKEIIGGGLEFVDGYRQVARGVLNPERMVARVLAAFEQVYGMQPRQTRVEDLCPAQPSTIAVWHALRTDEARIFAELADQFEAACPDNQIEIRTVPYVEIKNRFAEAARAGGGPDLLFESSRWLAPLAEEGLLLDLTERVSPRFLQQFVPKTVENMRYRGRLYAVPESVTLLALYYNRDLTNEVPFEISQLAQLATSARPLALPSRFYSLYFGVAAYGPFAFDSYTGELQETAGLVTWLTTLQSLAAQPGVDLYFQGSEADDAFAYEEAAYLVNGPWVLPRFNQELGADRFRVVPLPGGPFGPAGPMLQVQGAMINVNASHLAIDLALAFSYFLNLPESQRRFLETNSHVTASVTVDLAEYPNLKGFHDQIKSAVSITENSNFALLEQLGNDLYRAVLVEGKDPAAAVAEFAAAVKAAVARN